MGAVFDARFAASPLLSSAAPTRFYGA